jgi:hypothetical protein
MSIMTRAAMFERQFARPSNYFKLSGAQQWAVDHELGLLDWPGEGVDLTPDQQARMRAHYDAPQGGWGDGQV